jgi:DNA-binding NarL/FixJ family response regulator
MVEQARVILADDHRLLTECLSGVLRRDFDLVGTAENGRELLEKVDQLKPDVAVLDISMPLMNGVEAARRLSSVHPDIKIVFLSMHSDKAYVTEAFRAGGSAYVLKRCASGELVTAIQEVLRGKIYISSSVARPDHVGRIATRPELLTSRQRQVLQLVAEGYTAKEIAGQLAISQKTVEFHKATIMEKLRLRSTAQLTRYALEHGISGE